MDRVSRSNPGQERFYTSLCGSEPPLRRRLGRRTASIARVGTVGVLLLSLAATSGCVTKGRFIAAVEDAAYARDQAVLAQDKLKAAVEEITGLKADLSARDAKIVDLDASGANLARQIEELGVLNATLTDRLKRAGQSVESLAYDKSTLSKDLTNTRKKLDELEKQQQIAEARTRDLGALVAKFDALTAPGDAEISMRDGKLVVSVPSDALFEKGGDQLKASAKDTLTTLAHALQAAGKKPIAIAGHTDDTYAPTPCFPTNWELSTARAVRVTRALADAGVAPERLSASGYGEFAPTAPNDNDADRAKNRRIEITISAELSEETLPEKKPADGKSV
jgi:chemotaxis protein MotB